MKKSAVWMILFLLVCGCSGGQDQPAQAAPPSIALPPHTVADDSSLAPKDGRRVQLDSNNPDLTKEECSALINAYRHKGGKEGQLSVHKPSKILKGSMTPFCIENFDGQGIVFNDGMF